MIFWDITPAVKAIPLMAGTDMLMCNTLLSAIEIPHSDANFKRSCTSHSYFLIKYILDFLAEI